MPFEAKFLNLSSDNYIIEIIDPTTFDVSNTLKINASENKSIISNETRITFYLKNVSNKKEKLFFDLPEIELYTIDYDYQKNETMIKNDIQNKKHFGESVSISENDFTLELQRRSSVNLSPEHRFQPTKIPTELDISLKNDTTGVTNKTTTYQNTVIKTATSPAINPYAKSFGSNLVSSVTSTVGNSNGNYNSYRAPNSSSTGATVVHTTGNYNNYKPVSSTSVDNVTQMSKSVYQTPNNYQSVPSYFSKGNNQSNTYSNGNFGGNTYQSNSNNNPLTTSNYGFSSTGNFMTKSLSEKKSSSSKVNTSNPYSSRNLTNATASVVANKPTIKSENINTTTTTTNNYSKTPSSYQTNTFKTNNYSTNPSSYQTNNYSTNPSSYQTNNYSTNPSSYPTNNYSTNPSSYQSSTYKSYIPNNSANINSVTYHNGVGSSLSTSNYSQAKTVTYQPSGNIDYNRPKYMNPSMTKSMEFKAETTNNQYTSDAYIPSTQNNYSSTSSSYYNSATTNQIWRSNIEKSIGKVIKVSSESGYTSKKGSSRILATVSTDGKKLSELEAGDNQNAESKIETVTNIFNIPSTQIETNSEKIITTNSITENVLNNQTKTIDNTTSKSVENVEPVNVEIVTNLKNGSVKGGEISETTIITKTQNIVTENSNKELNEEVVQGETTTKNNTSNIENVDVSNQGTTKISTVITKTENTASSAKENLEVSPVETEAKNNTLNLENVEQGTTKISTVITKTENNESSAIENLEVSPVEITTKNYTSNIENVDVSIQGTAKISTEITKTENTELSEKKNLEASSTAEVIQGELKDDYIQGTMNVSKNTASSAKENLEASSSFKTETAQVIQGETTTINNTSNWENVDVSNQGTTKTENNASSAKENLEASSYLRTETAQVIPGETTTINNTSNWENVDVSNQGTTKAENNASSAKENLEASSSLRTETKTITKSESEHNFNIDRYVADLMKSFSGIQLPKTSKISNNVISIRKTDNEDYSPKTSKITNNVQSIIETYNEDDSPKTSKVTNNVVSIREIDNEDDSQITSKITNNVQSIIETYNEDDSPKTSKITNNVVSIREIDNEDDSQITSKITNNVVSIREIDNEDDSQTTSKITNNVVSIRETYKEDDPFKRKTSFFDIESIMKNFGLDSFKINTEIEEEVHTPLKESSENINRASLFSNVSLNNFSEENSLKESPERVSLAFGRPSSFEINLNHSPKGRKESIKITKKQNELIKKLSINASDKEKIAEIADDDNEEKKSTNKSENFSINFSAIEKNKKLIGNYEKSISKIISSIKFEEGFDIYESNMKNKITIMNMDDEEVYVRVNGNTEKEEELNLLKPNKMLKFDRESNKIHKLQICADKFTKRGPVYNVYANCTYKIINHQLQNESSGDFVSLSANRFFENNNNNNKYFLSFTESSLKNYNNILSLKNQQYISLFNASSNQIKIRIEADKTNDDDVIIVYPLMGISIQKQNPLYGYLTEIKQGEKIQKYMLKTNNVFSYDDEGLLINASNKEILNPVSNVLRINNEISLKNKNIVSNKNEYVNKEKEEYFEYEELNFDDENFNEFCIDNFCGEDIYIRVEKQEEGKEDFFLLKNEEEKWHLREDGLFLLEIVRTNLLSKRFVINTNYCYTIDKDFNFRESNTMKLIPQTFDRFRGFNLEIEGKTCAINYNAEQNSFFSENQEDSDLIYFNDIPSNFKRKEKFTDETFPATVDIIATKEHSHYPHSTEEVSKQILKNIVFLRPNEIFDENVFLFNNNNDDELSYITFVTQILNAINYDNPANIKKLIKSKEINPQGYYEVYFYDKDRKKKIMYIDDKFPVDKTYTGSDRHLYSECNSKEIWLQLLEKAFAKYEGGYSNILDGNIINELYFFTGAISFRFEVKDLNSWDYLKASNNPSTLTLATMKKDQTNEIKGIGIFENVFSILNVGEYYEPEEEQNIKLIKMRNLNVNSVNNIYSYSRRSKRWTTELKKFFNFDNAFKDEHVFFITFEEFQKDFDSFISSYIN